MTQPPAEVGTPAPNSPPPAYRIVPVDGSSSEESLARIAAALRLPMLKKQHKLHGTATISAEKDRLADLIDADMRTLGLRA